MRRCDRIMLIAAVLLVIAGCATVQTDFETPIVSIKTIRPLPSDSLALRFEVTLQVVNPNHDSLNLHGIVYSLALEGHKLLTGVAKDLPAIGGYDEEDVTFVAATNLLSGIRFLTDLMQNQPEVIAYELTAKLDPGGRRPAIHVREKGDIRLSAWPTQ